MRGAYGASAKTYLRKVAATKQEETPEKERCQSWHGTRRGKRDTRAGETLEKKEKQEETDPGQSRSRGKRKAGAGVRSLRSRYSSMATVAHGGTSSEHLSRETRSSERKGKTTQ